MPKDKAKATPVETAQDWITKHADEGLDLKALTAAVALVEKKTAEAHATAAKLGAILEARKEALKALKASLKAAKAARKAPLAPAPATESAPKPARKAAPAKATAKKITPAKKPAGN